MTLNETTICAFHVKSAQFLHHLKQLFSFSLCFTCVVHVNKCYSKKIVRQVHGSKIMNLI